MRILFIFLMSILSGITYADDKIDLSHMKLHALVVTVAGTEIRGNTYAELNAGAYAQPMKIVQLHADKPEIIKVELEDENGARVDVTADPRTAYQVMGNRLKVEKGVVTGLAEPLPGVGTFGLDDEAAVIIQFEQLDGGNDHAPQGKAGSVYVYFKIVK